MRKLVIVLLTAGLLNAGLKEDVENTASSFIDGAASFISAGILSTAGAQGGIPHFDAGVGVNLTGFKFRHPLTGDELVFPGVMPIVFGELGVFSGISLTPLINGVGAIDVMGRFMPAMPTKDYFNTSINPTYWAGGIKLQILKDQLVPPTPAISISLMYHSFGNVGFKFDSLYTDFSLSNLSIHADISKSLLFFSPYVGIGFDSYNLKGQYWTEGNQTKQDIANFNGNHMRYYGGVKFSFLLIKLFVEGAYIGNKTVVSLGVKAGI